MKTAAETKPAKYDTNSAWDKDFNIYSHFYVFVLLLQKYNILKKYF